MRPPAAGSLLADLAFVRLKEQVIRRTGLAYYADKDAELAARIAPHLARTEARDCAAYLALLDDGDKGAAELDILIEDLTIGETFFFRHSEMFDALRDVVLPDRIRHNQHNRQLRIWSAGCSSGAEPYSVSIQVRRDLAALVDGWDVTIIGTDINRATLARAREGRFEDWAFRSTPEELKRTCFEPRGSSWAIRSEYQERVSFQYHNLVAHPFPSLLTNLYAFDVILCRNVTIYFHPDIVRRLLTQFHQCLVGGGWLLVGHSEPNLELFRSFRTINVPGAVLYQKINQADIMSGLWPLPSGSERAPQSPGAESWQTWTPPLLSWQAPFVAEPTPPPARPVVTEREKIRAYADRGLWRQAADYCEQTLTRDKLNPVVHFYHALMLEQLGQHDAAENALRRVLYLDRNFVLAHYYLGVLQQQNLPGEAARSFRNVLRLLNGIPGDYVFSDGDGLTAADLARLTNVHLEIMEGA